MPLPEMWRLPLRQGWSVIPLRERGKQPAIRSWARYQHEHADRGTLTEWAKGGFNVGIVTGVISGLVVLDLDNAAAIEEAERLGLPPSITVRTANGRHVYFRHPGGRIGNRTGLLPGTDVRGDGGYVVGPGSVHPSGVRYEWVVSPDEAPLAEPPRWLIDGLDGQGDANPRPNRLNCTRRISLQGLGRNSAYGLAALQSEASAIRRAINGQQEITLNTAGLRIGALVAGGELCFETARTELVRAGMSMPNHDHRHIWTLDAVVAKVDRAMADGAAHPRSAPQQMGAIDG